MVSQVPIAVLSQIRSCWITVLEVTQRFCESDAGEQTAESAGSVLEERSGAVDKIAELEKMLPSGIRAVADRSCQSLLREIDEIRSAVIDLDTVFERCMTNRRDAIRIELGGHERKKKAIKAYSQ